MKIEELVVAISTDGRRAEILQGTYGQGQHAEIPSELISEARSRDRLQDWQRASWSAGDQRDTRRRHSPPPPPPYDAETEGQEILEMLFPGELREAYRQCLASARRSGHPLRLRLVLRSDAGLEELHSVPWELAFDKADTTGLARDPGTPFVRSPGVGTSTDREPAEPPLRILLAFPEPAERVALELDREAERISDKLGTLETGVRFESVPTPVTLEAVHRAFVDFHPHIFHFGGHGSFDAEGIGCLDFVAGDGTLRQVSGKTLASALRKPGHQLALVVLNACRTADRPEPSQDPFRAVANALVAAGQNAVVAMQGPIRDAAALELSATLYDRIAGGDGVDLAMNTARNRLYLDNPKSPEWAIPTLSLRSPGGAVIRPSGSPGPAAPSLRLHMQDRSALVHNKTRRFVGRRFVFEALDGFLKGREGCFLIEAEPGIGKTTFLAELLRRRRYIHHFNERGSIRASRTEPALQNLCAQVIRQYELPYNHLPQDAGRDWSRLCELLEEASKTAGPDSKQVILVDALDEAELQPGGHGNVLDIPRHLPPGVCLVLTARSDADVPLRFDGDLDQLEINSKSPENLDDIREFIRQSVTRPNFSDYLRERKLGGEDFVDLLAERSEGNFMYLHYVLHEIEQGHYRTEDPRSLPHGLRSYYEDHWRRMRASNGDQTWFDLELPVLAVVTLAKQPASVKLIAGMLDRRGDEARIAATLRQWSQFLHVSEAEDSPDTKHYRLYHGSFHDFIHAKDEVTAERVKLSSTRRRMIDYLRRAYRGLGGRS